MRHAAAYTDPALESRPLTGFNTTSRNGVIATIRDGIRRDFGYFLRTHSGRFLSLHNRHVIEARGSSNGIVRFVNVARVGHSEMVRNWPIACGSAFAQRALEWRPFRSPRVATRDYFGGGAWTAARTCNMPYRNGAHNPRHCDTRRCADAARLPNTAAPQLRYSISLLHRQTMKCHGCDISQPASVHELGRATIVTAFDF